MVDLVKIRRKAKEKAVRAAAEQAGNPAHAPGILGSSGPAEGEIDSPAERLERYKEQVGKARFLVSGAAEDEPSSNTEAELLTFMLGGEQYAIDIGLIVEIIPARPVARVPNADPSIVGIISLRGTIVTLLDVRSRLRHSPAPPTTDSRIVVIDRRGETVGFVVDKVLRVVKADMQRIEPPPAVHPTERSEYIMGVFRQRNSLTILLEVERLLSA